MDQKYYEGQYALAEKLYQRAIANDDRLKAWKQEVDDSLLFFEARFACASNKDELRNLHYSRNFIPGCCRNSHWPSQQLAGLVANHSARTVDSYGCAGSELGMSTKPIGKPDELTRCEMLSRWIRETSVSTEPRPTIHPPDPAVFKLMANPEKAVVSITTVGDRGDPEELAEREAIVLVTAFLTRFESLLRAEYKEAWDNGMYDSAFYRLLWRVVDEVTWPKIWAHRNAEMAVSSS